MIDQFNFSSVFLCFSAFHWLPSVGKLRMTLVSFVKITAIYEVMRFHWSPLIGKLRMTLVSFVKITGIYEVSLVTINWQTSYDSDILCQD